MIQELEDVKTITKPSQRGVFPAEASNRFPIGIRAFTEGTTGHEVPDENYGDTPLSRPNRNRPLNETVSYDEPQSIDLTIATENSGALDFWDDPKEGECSDEHGDPA